MMTLLRVLDAAKARCEPANDSGIAARLGITRAAVSAWRQGGVISEKHLTALVDLSMLDPAVAVDVLKEQAQTDAQRVIWGSLSGRLLHLMSAVHLSARKVAARFGAHP